MAAELPPALPRWGLAVWVLLSSGLSRLGIPEVERRPSKYPPELRERAVRMPQVLIDFIDTHMAGYGIKVDPSTYTKPGPDVPRGGQEVTPRSSP